MASDSTKPRSSREDVLQFLDSLDTYAAAPAPSTPAPAPRVAVGGTPTSATKTAIPIKQKAPPVTPAAQASAPPAAAPAPAAAAPPAANAAEAQSVLDFLDEITQRSATPTAPIPKQQAAASPAQKQPISRSTSRSQLASSVGPAAIAGRRSTDSARSAVVAPSSPSTRAQQPPPQHEEKPPQQQADAGGGGWGWGSVWNSASAAVQQASQIAAQARTVAEEQVKNAGQHAGGGLGGIVGAGEGLFKALGENEQAKKWSSGVMEYARGVHLDQLGNDLKSQTLRGLTDLLNAVAPPIAEHEVIQVSLSHDMVGYDGVETLVYRGLAKVMEQIEGGTLVLNKGQEEKRREASEGGTNPEDEERDLKFIEGLDAGWKLAEANLDQLIKISYDPEQNKPAPQEAGNITVPVTTCPIYLRIQPCLAPLPFHPSSSAAAASGSSKEGQALFFLVLLKDPGHNLSHASLSQSIPGPWLDIPFEENEWVEDVMVDVIRRTVEIVGQEYVSGRMRAQADAIAKARAAAQQTLAEQAEQQPQHPEPHATEQEAAEAAATARVV